MAERLIVPFRLHEPSGGATFDDPSICYQHPDPLTVDGVGLDQIGIELMLADQLAQPVADFGTTVVSVLAVDRLGWELLRLQRGRSRFG